ncbi:MAG TPA: hypothetical protein VFZ59_20885 [Verrucomicrobiae bacterium]|nr:hypothetical protein [Verrucomicrobiae bacterium]
MGTPSLEQGVTFGPFRMPHFQEQVDDRFRRAFYNYIAQNVIPACDGKIDRIEGRVSSHYDQAEFANLGEVKSRYYYEIACFSPGGVEEASGELDYDPVTASWTPSRVKSPGVRTLSHKRRHKAWLESHRYRPPQPEECPQCRSKQVAEIIYGMIGFRDAAGIQAFQAALDSGKICQGGVWDWDQSPQWRCLSCKHEWGLTGYALALREIEGREKES